MRHLTCHGIGTSTPFQFALSLAFSVGVSIWVNKSLLTPKKAYKNAQPLPERHEELEIKSHSVVRQNCNLGGSLSIPSYICRVSCTWNCAKLKKLQLAKIWDIQKQNCILFQYVLGLNIRYIFLNILSTRSAKYAPGVECTPWKKKGIQCFRNLPYMLLNLNISLTYPPTGMPKEKWKGKHRDLGENNNCPFNKPNTKTY